MLSLFNVMVTGSENHTQDSSSGQQVPTLR